MRRARFFAIPLLVARVRFRGKVDDACGTLDELFKEIDDCDTTSAASSGGTCNSSSSIEPAKICSLKVKPPPISDRIDDDDARIKTERGKGRRLQRMVEQANSEVEALTVEKEKAVRQRHLETVAASPTAKPFLSTFELIQEKSPQHFVACEGSKEEIGKLPHIRRSGCAGVISLVGRVLFAADACSNRSVIKLPGDEEAVFTDLQVEYEVPFVSGEVSTKVLVRCYGVTMSTFATEHIRCGDVIHALGHLCPVVVPSPGGPSVAVCVLPVGGNLSVLLKAK